MKALTTFLVTSLSATIPTAGQTPTLAFDGLNDYVDLGTSIGTGLRTMELWFKLETPFSSSSLIRQSLLTRNTANEIGEIQLSIQESSQPGPGRIGFGIGTPSGYEWVYSDTNAWPAGQWFHVAAVIDPAVGMRLFVDGVRQQDANPLVTAPTPASANILAIGVHGDAAIRWFGGQIEDVRLSSGALYTSDFEPLCPDISSHPTSVGTFHFNEGTGSVAVDSSQFGNHATIYGAQYQTDLVCVNTMVDELRTSDLIKSVPNPSGSSFKVDLSLVSVARLEVVLVDLLGRTIEERRVENQAGQLEFQGLKPGCYFVWLLGDGRLLAQVMQIVF